MKRKQWAFGAGVVAGLVLVLITERALFSLSLELCVLGALLLVCVCATALVTGRGRAGTRHDVRRGVAWGALGGAVAVLGLLGWIVFVGFELSRFD